MEGSTAASGEDLLDLLYNGNNEGGAGRIMGLGMNGAVGKVTMHNTELPSIQYLLSSLEEPQRPYALPALMLPPVRHTPGALLTPGAMHTQLSATHLAAAAQQPAPPVRMPAGAAGVALLSPAPEAAPLAPLASLAPLAQAPAPAPAPAPTRTTALGPARAAASAANAAAGNSASAATHCTCKSRRSSSHIPRPRNAFILFRQHFHHELFPKNENMLSTLGSFRTNSEISREIGQRWRGLSDKEKQYWHDLALQEKERHKMMYPDYKYIPRKVELESRQCEYCAKKKKRN